MKNSSSYLLKVIVESLHLAKNNNDKQHLRLDYHEKCKDIGHNKWTFQDIFKNGFINFGTLIVDNGLLYSVVRKKGTKLWIVKEDNTTLLKITNESWLKTCRFFNGNYWEIINEKINSKN